MYSRLVVSELVIWSTTSSKGFPLRSHTSLGGGIPEEEKENFTLHCSKDDRRGRNEPVFLVSIASEIKLINAVVRQREQ